jgi:CRP-like cAMP-binding protein
MESLKRTILNSVALSPAEIQLFLSSFEHRLINKGQFFVAAGKRCAEVAFVKSGLLRIFYNNDKGLETTCHFTLPGNFVTSLNAFANGGQSTENIQALLTTEIYIITKSDLEDLYRQIPAAVEFGKNAAEKITLIMERRLFFLLNKSADEHYRAMLQEQPELVQQVPLQYLASYLGITPQHLSRLRKKVVSRSIS